MKIIRMSNGVEQKLEFPFTCEYYNDGSLAESKKMVHFIIVDQIRGCGEFAARIEVNKSMHKKLIDLKRNTRIQFFKKGRGISFKIVK